MLVGALPRSPRALGHDVRLILPGLRKLWSQLRSARAHWRVRAMGQTTLRSDETRPPQPRLPLYLVGPSVFNPERIYGPATTKIGASPFFAKTPARILLETTGKAEVLHWP